jgi:AcrR family transcriptional regulator
MVSLSPPLSPMLAEATPPRLRKKLTILRAVMDAAHRLVAEVGPRTFTVVEVARRSGVARTTIYKYFGLKAGLLLACKDELARQRKGTRASSPPLAQVRAKRSRARGESRLHPTLEAVRQALLALAENLEAESDLFLLTAAEGVRSCRPPRSRTLYDPQPPLPPHFFQGVVRLLADAQQAGNLARTLDPTSVAGWLTALWWHHLCLRGPLGDKRPKEHGPLATSLEQLLGALGAA